MSTVNEKLVFKVLKEECKGYLHLAGFRYLETALNILLQNDLNIPTMTLYNMVSEKYGTTISAVERNIRYLIKAVYSEEAYSTQIIYELAYKILYLQMEE